MPDKVPTGAATLVIILVLSLTVAFALPAGAQALPVIRQAELRLWPEYDDPGLLVIVSGSFESDTPFPLRAAFPIPDGARNVQATYMDASGTLVNRPFEIEDGKLVYELPSADFHYEFYLDRAASGDQRTISYVLDAPYAIQTLGVAVQQPARADRLYSHTGRRELRTESRWAGLSYSQPPGCGCGRQTQFRTQLLKAGHRADRAAIGGHDGRYTGAERAKPSGQPINRRARLNRVAALASYRIGCRAAGREPDLLDSIATPQKRATDLCARADVRRGPQGAARCAIQRCRRLRPQGRPQRFAPAAAINCARTTDSARSAAHRGAHRCLGVK